MARIVFWNVNKKDLTLFVCAIARVTSADVVVLNENVVSVRETLRALKKNVTKDFYVPDSASEQRFHCFCRDRRLDLSEVHAGNRTSVRKLKLGTNLSLLGLVHGVDPRNYDAATRQSFAQELASEMQFVKQQQKSNRLAMIGDFNMNPFDPGMNLATCLNAMMTRQCTSAGRRIYLQKEYDFYYNPMWSLFGDNTPGPAGTVFDTSSQGPYGWSMFDQVILNHSLIRQFRHVEILTYAGESSLMDNRGRPDSEKASDHFPISVTLCEEENG